MYYSQVQGMNLDNIWRNFSHCVVLFCNKKHVATRNTDRLVLQKFSLKQYKGNLSLGPKISCKNGDPCGFCLYFQCLSTHTLTQHEFPSAKGISIKKDMKETWLWGWGWEKSIQKGRFYFLNEQSILLHVIYVPTKHWSEFISHILVKALHIKQKNYPELIF
jgi:hypothetical protein